MVHRHRRDSNWRRFNAFFFSNCLFYISVHLPIDYSPYIRMYSCSANKNAEEYFHKYPGCVRIVYPNNLSNPSTPRKSKITVDYCEYNSLQANSRNLHCGSCFMRVKGCNRSFSRLYRYMGFRMCVALRLLRSSYKSFSRDRVLLSEVFLEPICPYCMWSS